MNVLKTNALDRRIYKSCYFCNILGEVRQENFTRVWNIGRLDCRRSKSNAVRVSHPKVSSNGASNTLFLPCWRMFVPLQLKLLSKKAYFINFSPLELILLKELKWLSNASLDFKIFQSVIRWISSLISFRAWLTKCGDIFLYHTI